MSLFDEYLPQQGCFDNNLFLITLCRALKNRKVVVVARNVYGKSLYNRGLAN